LLELTAIECIRALFIKCTKRTLRGKTYTNHLLVESIATERGPRHRLVCSLGSFGPAPKGSGSNWLIIFKSAWGKKERNAAKDIHIDLEQVEVEEARQAGAAMSATRSGSGWNWTKSLPELASATRPAC
jgi:hypothetical protein